MKFLNLKSHSGLRLSVLTFVILGTSATFISAQGSGPLTASARRLDEFNKQTDKALKDDKDRQVDGKKAAATELRKTAAVRAEIEEDLNGLQFGYNEIVIKLQSKEAITERFVAEVAGKINKHAERLKRNIRFPKAATEPNEEPPVQSDLTQRKRLLELCNEVLAFFDSPFFENPIILDIPNAIEARKLLENIISKSGDLKTLPG